MEGHNIAINSLHPWCFLSVENLEFWIAIPPETNIYPNVETESWKGFRKTFRGDAVVFFVKEVEFFHGSLGENYVFASTYGNLYETKIKYTVVKVEMASQSQGLA